jgi:hypothetical protein
LINGVGRTGRKRRVRLTLMPMRRLHNFAGFCAIVIVQRQRLENLPVCIRCCQCLPEQSSRLE